ncbi:MAG: hypothetical protein COU51_01400 [Parcubacteria group bacterium CG10_big_fil_rev_8_21_14_0_10_36_14]|nr:MAG: hypothetical protein COU51_01400 [Parcubacteria group bacterium CG10_big_fil_rev_8_21_14_0_10_36_14]
MDNFFTWALVIFLNFITYFIARFGIISNGKNAQQIYILGLISHLLSFAYGFYKLGFWGFIILLPVSYFFVRTIVTLLIDRLENILYPNRKQIFEKWANKLNKNPGDIKEQFHIDRFKTDDEKIDEAWKKHFGKSFFNK